MDTIVRDMAASDGDERKATRFDGRLACKLHADGAEWACWLRDLSTDGAGLEPPMPALLGREVALDSADFPFARPLPGRVVNVAHRRTCIAFDLDPQAKAAVQDFIEDNS